MLICDTSGLIAYFDAGDAQHPAVSVAIDADPGPFVVSPYVLAELEYLIATRRGIDAQLVALQELCSGAWELPCLQAPELRLVRDLVGRYRDQDIGVADASLVVLADRYRTDRLLTLDHRHFRVLRNAAGQAFELLPE
ncbi:MAG: PIN domain-containing protein [Trebonia sp.]